MKKIILLGILVTVILVSAGVIYKLSNPSCCNASNTNSAEFNLSAHASPPDFKKAIESGKYKLIDIRTIAEFNAGHINKATQTDFYQTKDFHNYLDSLDKKGKYLIYCHTGNRSGQALKITQEKGFTNVSDLSGGINAWISYGFSVVK
jgi:phage shock protein E